MSVMCMLRLYTYIRRTVTEYYNIYIAEHGTHSRYYLSDDGYEYEEEDSFVPVDTIFVEQWRRGEEVRRRVLYEGETITQYKGDPWAVVETPWLWIGDTTTDVDLTYALSKYMVPGNVITLDLLLRLIQIHEDTELVYLHPRTCEEIPFPNEGVRIEAKHVA